MKKLFYVSFAVILLLAIGSFNCVEASIPWTKGQMTDTYGEHYPQSVIDSANNKIYYVWEGSKQIWTAEMNTDGTGWTATQRTSTSVEKRLPQLVLDKKNSKLYYVWQEGDLPQTTHQLWTAQMNTDGTGWSASVRTTSSYYKTRPQMVLDSTYDKLYFVWEEWNDQSSVPYPDNRWQIWTAQMNIDGTGFSAVRRTVTAHEKNRPQIILDSTNQKLYYAWEESDDLAIWQIWTAEMNTDATGWSVTKRTGSSLNNHMPQLTLDAKNDLIFYTWIQGSPLSTVPCEVWVAKTNIDGTGWTGIQCTSNTFSKEYPQILLDSVNSKLYFTWEEMDSESNLNIWKAEMNSSFTGWTAEQFTNRAGGNFTPQFSFDTKYKRLFFVWEGGWNIWTAFQYIDPSTPVPPDPDPGDDETPSNPQDPDAIYTDNPTGVSKVWYFAEGSTSGFETWILLQNPNNKTAKVNIQCMDQAGFNSSKIFDVPAKSRLSVNLKTIPFMANKSGVSTKVETLNNVGIVAERSMYWGSGGGHCSLGIISPATTWYLAEGSTKGFDTWILIQNANNTDADVRITFMEQGTSASTSSAQTIVTTTIKKNSRYSINVNKVTGLNNKVGISTKVESLNNVPTIVERSMYWNSGGGHGSSGITNPSTKWYLAEGSTSGFDTWVLILNPNTIDAAVKITYMDDSSYTAVDTFTVKAKSRVSRNINAFKLNGIKVMDQKTGVSTKIESTNGVGLVVERAMYFGTMGGHCSSGVISSAKNWYLAEGSTKGFQTWLLLQNPSSKDAIVKLIYMDDAKGLSEETVTVKAFSRFSRNANTAKFSGIQAMNNKSGISLKVESRNGVGVIAERAMYWENSGTPYANGHCSVGYAK